VSSLPSEPQHERRQGERRKEERERIRQFEERIAGEQDERRRLALMLHDGAVQALAGIALMLDAVDHAIAESRNDDARRILASALEQQRATIHSLRNLSFNIEPVALRDQGFEPAVRALAERVGLDREVRVDVDVAPAEALAERAQVTFYQLIRARSTGQPSVGRAASRSRSPTTMTAGFASRSPTTGHPERRQNGIEGARGTRTAPQRHR
jgi:signal transduction histidine kinase